MSIIFKFEKCPCGSGKKYADCCYQLHHKYQKIKLRNPQAKCKHLVFDKTIYNECLNRINGFVDYHIKQDFQTNLKDYPNLLYYIDKVMETIYPYTDCHKGCDACCRMNVSTFEFEAELIKKHIANNWSKEERNELHRKIHQMKLEHPEIFYLASTKIRFIGVPCPFLKDGCCSVYDCRPFMCRKYVSFLPANICYDAQLNPETQNQTIEISLFFEIIDKLFNFLNSQSRTVTGTAALPFWFGDY